MYGLNPNGWALSEPVTSVCGTFIMHPIMPGTLGIPLIPSVATVFLPITIARLEIPTEWDPTDMAMDMAIIILTDTALAMEDIHGFVTMDTRIRWNEIQAMEHAPRWNATMM